MHKVKRLKEHAFRRHLAKTLNGTRAPLAITTRPTVRDRLPELEAQHQQKLERFQRRRPSMLG